MRQDVLSGRSGGGGRRRAGPVAVVGALVVLAGVAAACSSSTPSASAALPAPKGLPSFYSVPQPLPSGGPGTLVKTPQKVAVSAIHGTAYRVMYMSESVQDKPVAVTGPHHRPRAVRPGDGYPVVSWGHGTNGMADQCAPSLDPPRPSRRQRLLDRGGRSRPATIRERGLLASCPTSWGSSAARNTIDIVRAARHLPAAHASADYVVWGHSEGGQTAMFAFHIGASYAPELHLKGVVAGAPPSQFFAIYQFSKTSPYRYYLLMVAGGFNAAYGNQPRRSSQVLTPLGTACCRPSKRAVRTTSAPRSRQVPLPRSPRATPSRPGVGDTAKENDPGNVHDGKLRAAAHHPGREPTSRSRWSPPRCWPPTCAVWARISSAGSTRDRAMPGSSSHRLNDMIHWITDRFAGVAEPRPLHADRDGGDHHHKVSELIQGTGRPDHSAQAR